MKRKSEQPAAAEEPIYEAEPKRVQSQYEPEAEEPLYEPAPGGASGNTAVALYDYEAGECISHSVYVCECHKGREIRLKKQRNFFINLFIYNTSTTRKQTLYL